MAKKTGYDGERMAKRQRGKGPEFLFDTTPGKDMARGFTLVLCFSRAWCVRNFFAAFNNLKIDLSRCHLLIMDNSDSVVLQEELRKKAEIYKDAFYTFRLYKTWRQGGRELVTQENAEWNVGKLPYIYEMHKDFLRLCTTDKFVLMEDDTLPPYKKRPDVVMYMLGQLEKRPRCAVYTAIETGRSSVAYAKSRLGIHFLKRKGNKILWRLSPSPHLRGIHRVHACGWYCCAARREPWLRALDGMDEYIEDVPRFAMDVMHTNNIMRNGWDVLADFSLWCVHMNHTPDVIIFWAKKQCRAQLDVWLPEWRTYAQGVLLTGKESRKVLRRMMSAEKSQVSG